MSRGLLRVSDHLTLFAPAEREDAAFSGASTNYTDIYRPGPGARNSVAFKIRATNMTTAHSVLSAALKGERMRDRMRVALLACLAILCMVQSASAQVNTADILGTVSDAGGAVLPNAKVTVQNTATNETKVATTNAAGDFVFNLMQPGQYTVTVEAPSFK